MQEDVFHFEYVSKLAEYSQMGKPIQFILSHGQADVERGFKVDI